MKKPLIILALTLLALIAGLGAWGASLPREHHASSRVTVAAPPESVYNTMRDLVTTPVWWKDLKKIESVPGTDGWERWKEASGGMSFVVVVDQEDPPVSFRTRIDTTGHPPFGGIWTYEVAIAEGGRSTVTLSEDGTVDNAFFRVEMKLMGTHATLDSYLAALSVKFGHPATPVHVLP
jgi:uncharacterized protein YndB with AHSA1/START domain